ncbi:MAG: ATP-binding protein, partial [Thermogemmata sp.]|nr:ATP-binding protein [Thermogemmata sp.]
MNAGDLPGSQLKRWELLREFKIRRYRLGADNFSPFVDRVASHYETPPAVDVAQIHEQVRQSIIEQIRAVHQQQRSQIVLLAGEAGAGKTHLLRYFAYPKLAEEHKYVFVSGSNDWKVDEFQPCVLDWLITALTRPAPTEEHLLLQRIRAVAFRALDQLIANRTALRRCRAKRRWLGWLLGRRVGSHELIQRLTQARDPRVFDYLDFDQFADEVSLRFLAEPSNPIHRYALRVLLSYVFPDSTPAGLNVRDRVIHWFRRRPDDGYWLRRFGVDENLDR